jgi:hypothetical protein
MQALFPNPNPGNTNLTANYAGSISGGQYSAIPTLKIDEIISSKDKLSFYWSRNNVETQINTGPFAADGLPLEIGQYRGGLIPTNTWRLNYDRTLTPTLLFYFGAGYVDTIFNDQAPFLSFNPDQFGLTGFIQHRQFPSVTGMQGTHDRRSNLLLPHCLIPHSEHTRTGTPPLSGRAGLQSCACR